MHTPLYNWKSHFTEQPARESAFHSVRNGDGDLPPCRESIWVSTLHSGRLLPRQHRVSTSPRGTGAAGGDLPPRPTDTKRAASGGAAGGSRPPSRGRGRGLPYAAQTTAPLSPWRHFEITLSSSAQINNIICKCLPTLYTDVYFEIYTNSIESGKTKTGLEIHRNQRKNLPDIVKFHSVFWWSPERAAYGLETQL